MEEWREVPGFEGKYIASNDGRIRTTVEYIENPHKGKIRIQKNRHFKKDTLIGGKLSEKGYSRVNLGKNVYLVHRIIALTFIPNPNNLPQINHIDGNKLNNNVANLEWVTNQENRDHAVINDLVARRDKNHGNQKLTTEQCYEIVELCKTSNMTQRKIAEKYKVSPTAIYKVNLTYGKN